MSIVSELQNMQDVSSQKRKALHSRANDTERLARMLAVGSGLIALLAGFITTAVFTELISSTILKVGAATLTFLSGATSLVGSTYASGKAVEDLYDGAAGFLSLRDRIALACARPGASEKSLLAVAENFGAEYAELSAKYDRYLSKNDMGHFRLIEMSQRA